MKIKTRTAATPQPTSIRVAPDLWARLQELPGTGPMSATIDRSLRQYLAHTCRECGALHEGTTVPFFATKADVVAWAKRYSGEAGYLVVDYGNGPRAYKGRVIGISDGNEIGLAPMLSSWAGNCSLLARYVVYAEAGMAHSTDVGDFESKFPGIPVDPWGRVMPAKTA